MPLSRQLTDVALVRHTVRGMPWPSLPVAALLAVALARAGGGTEPTVVATILAVGGAPLLDDAAAATLACSPTSLARRRAPRLVLSLAGAATLWVGLVFPLSGRGIPRLPPLSASLEMAVFVAIVLALAAAGLFRPWGGGSGSPLATAGLLVFVGATHLLPGRWAIYPVQSHQAVWLLILVAAAVTIALASRDPLSASPGR